MAEFTDVPVGWYKKPLWYHSTCKKFQEPLISAFWDTKILGSGNSTSWLIGYECKGMRDSVFIHAHACNFQINYSKTYFMNILRCFHDDQIQPQN